MVKKQQDESDGFETSRRAEETRGMKDLWPKDFIFEDLTSPVAILQQQGEFLSQRTNGVLVGTVNESKYRPKLYSQTRSSGSKRRSGKSRRRSQQEGLLGYKFCIDAPSLSYRYSLFRIFHDPSMYPVDFLLDSDVAKDMRESSIHLIAENEKDFLGILKRIFATKKVRSMIGTLILKAEE
jgi:hypothetical protein